MTLAELQELTQRLRCFVADFEPDCVDGAQARGLVASFEELERLAGAGKALAARQVVATGAWRHEGHHRDAAAWFAATTAMPLGRARAALDTAARLAALPATEAAVRAGTLSSAQTEAITGAASAAPDAEGSLLERAEFDGLGGLRKACARAQAAACVDELDAYERVRAARSLRSWTDPDGTGRIDVRGPVDAVARVLAAMKPYRRALFEQARDAERRERSDALAFDALVALADAPREERGKGGPRGTDTTVVVRIDHAALLRGHTEPGELCEIVGVGPIPVAKASQLLDDCFVKAVVLDGTDVTAVSHPGRTIPARMRTAVEEMYDECIVEGCNATEHLEIDHNLPIEAGGPTELWNLGPLCPHDHDYKHRHDLRLVGTGTRQRFVSASEWQVPEAVLRH
jgi:hypothetical protein